MNLLYEEDVNTNFFLLDPFPNSSDSNVWSPLVKEMFLSCSWLCHIDDDMYVNLKPLVDTLSLFDPVKEKIYLGRSGSLWEEAREVKQESGLGTAGKRYHFAVGGMYCLSRAMMEAIKDYLR